MVIIKYAKTFGILILCLISSVLVLSILNYLNVITGFTLTLIKFLILIISIIVSGFLIGKNTSEKGYIEGIKFGLLTSLIFMIYSYLGTDSKINLKHMLFYLIIIALSMFGSMIGIQKKKD